MTCRLYVDTLDPKDWRTASCLNQNHGVTPASGQLVPSLWRLPRLVTILATRDTRDMDAETTRYLVRLGECNVWSLHVINNKLNLAQEAFAEFDKNNTGTINQKVTDICHMNMIINLFT